MRDGGRTVGREVALTPRDADLQPHRDRYWKTPHPGRHLRYQVAQMLWCYEQVQQLAERDEMVLCVDEKPNLQVLRGVQPMGPGLIERRWFEYSRHGT